MKKIFALSLFLLGPAAAMAQGARDFKISEVYVAAPDSACCGGEGYRDEYGEVSSWIEIFNTSYTTHDIRSCHLTNNRAVLDKSLSTSERIAMMSPIPKGDARTNLTGKQRITFFADGNVNRGTLHVNFRLKPGVENFIALYDGNGVTLLDSVTVPATLGRGESYARIYNADGDSCSWVVANPEMVTPNAPNEVNGVQDDKVAEWKKSDPHGIAMTIISMGIVFLCLILLYVFFHVFGWILNRISMLNRVKSIRKIHESAAKLVVMAKEGTETKGIEMENYAAAIGLALYEYMGYMHDVESGVLTIQHHQTEWDSKDHVLRQTPPVHINN